MLLAIDVGNTNIDMGLFDGKELRTNWDLATDVYKTSDEYAVILLTLLQQQGFSASDIDQAAI